MACMIGVILTVAGFEGRRAGLHRIADHGAGDGFLPGVGQRYMRRITGTDDIAFGTSVPAGYVLSGWIGGLW